jgi:hypothetical protein
MLLFKNVAMAAAQWALLLVIRLALIIIGLPVVAIAIPFAAPGLSASDGRPIWNLPRLAWLWGNDFDGLDGDKRLWWADNCDALVLFGLLPLLRRLGLPIGSLPVTSWLARWWWAALRNPVNNLRLVPGFNCPVGDCQLTHWGRFTVEDKPGMGGWQFVVARRNGGTSRWFGLYWVHEWTISRAFVVRLGYKIKPGHAFKIGEPAKGLTFKINPVKEI